MVTRFPVSSITIVLIADVDNSICISIFNMVTENFDQDNMLGAVGLNKQDMVNFAEQIKSLSKAASEGDLKSIAQQGLKFTGQMAKSPLSKFFSIAYKMAKSFNSIGGVFGNIASPVSEVTTEVAEKAQTIGDKVKNVAKDTWDKLKEGAKSFWAGIFGNNDSTSGSGSNLRRVRAIINGEVKAVTVCAKCLRSGKIVRA